MNAFMLTKKLVEIYRDIGFEVDTPHHAFNGHGKSWMIIIRGPHDYSADMPGTKWGAIYVDPKLNVTAEGSRRKELLSVLGL